MDTVTHFATNLLGLSTQPGNLSVAQGVARALLVYIVLIAVVRLGKKRFLGQATAFDVILLIIIGSIAGRAIVGSARLIVSLLAVLTLVAFHWIISYLLCDWPWFGTLVKGHSTVLIKNGKVIRAALRDAHMSDDDLEEDLRHEGVSRVSDVAEARLERDGKLSVLKK
ncbi:MAG: DUF421 domain-containing protein [Pseudolabrys sp.]